MGSHPERRTKLAYKCKFNGEMSVTLLATNDDEMTAYEQNCEKDGLKVDGKAMWTGPVPPNSYMFINPFLRMSTPEFFAFRKSNELELGDAVALVAELLSNVRTERTAIGMPEGIYEDLAKHSGPRMNASDYRDYLAEVADTPEGARAIVILEMAIEVVGEVEHDVRTNLTEVPCED